MASFSSVVRKGSNIAPKVAPRRNIVRKAHIPPTAPLAQVDRDTATDSPAPSHSQNTRVTNEQLHRTAYEENGFQATTASPNAANQSRSNTEEVDPSLTPSTEPHNERVNGDGPSASIRQSHVHIPDESQAVDERQPADTVQLNEAHSENHGRGIRQESAITQPFDGHDQSVERPELSLDDNDTTNSEPTIDRQAVNSASSKIVGAKTRQSRKRKQPPHASANIILSQPSILVAPTSLNPRSPVPSRSPEAQRASSIPLSVASQRSGSQTSAVDDFEHVRLRLQGLRESIAAGPNASSPPLRGSRAPTATSTDAQDGSTARTDLSRPRKRRRTNRSQPPSAEEQAAEIIENVMGQVNETEASNARRPRGATPEDAEEHEIAPEITRMGELCKDRKWGKKSETEKEMAANWEEILRRRKEDAELRIAAAASGSRRKRDKERTGQSEAEQTSTGATAVPVLAIENGVIVATTREVDRRGHLDGVVQDTDPNDVREDKDIYKRVLATTVGCRNPIAPGQTWDDLSTDLFYTGLKKFGTDFQMISAMIPGKTRKQVKLKYNVEERKNWPRVKRCLSTKEDVNLEEYAEATGVQFASVADVYKQMEDDEKRLREEDEQRRRDEGIISQDQDGAGDADVVLPSIEGETEAEGAQNRVAGTGVGATERQSTASRLGSTTTARQTAQPQGQGKRKQPGKKNATSKKARQAAGKNKGLEGVEERLGGIEEVAMPVV